MFPEINKILFASDISDIARHAFDYVVSLANQYEASIVILHVMEDFTPDMRDVVSKIIGEDLYDEIKQDGEKSARDALINKKRQAILSRDAFSLMSKKARQRAEESGRSFVTEDIIVTEGNIVAQIVDEAEKLSCDVIVMGFKRRSRLSEVLIPSTVKGVIRKSRIPVLVVPMREEDLAQ